MRGCGRSLKHEKTAMNMRIIKAMTTKHNEQLGLGLNLEAAAPCPQQITEQEVPLSHACTLSSNLTPARRVRESGHDCSNRIREACNPLVTAFELSQPSHLPFCFLACRAYAAMSTLLPIVKTGTTGTYMNLLGMKGSEHSTGPSGAHPIDNHRLNGNQNAKGSLLYCTKLIALVSLTVLICGLAIFVAFANLV